MEQEQEKNKILSEALETLATEHHELERSLVEGSLPVSILSEDEFYDALSGNSCLISLVLLEVESITQCLCKSDCHLEFPRINLMWFISSSLNYCVVHMCVRACAHVHAQVLI